MLGILKVILTSCGLGLGQNLSYDFNHDGMVDSLILAQEPLCGNAGCKYLIKISNEQMRYDTATIFLHPMAFRVTKNKKGGNWITLYHRQNAVMGDLIKLLLKRNAIQEKERSMIYPGEQDSVLYKTMFENAKE